MSLTVPRPAGRNTLGDQVFSRTAGAHLIGGNRVGLLKDGRENYPAWLDAIRSARSFIHFENYLVQEDEVGMQFAEALVRKAGDGIRVRFIYDWIGCFGRASPGFWRRLKAGGVDVRSFNPPRLDQPVGWVTRDHRKCVVVDGRIAFVTGLCVGAQWVGNEQQGRAAWRDTGVSIEGPAVAEVEAAFARSWATLGAPLPPGESTGIATNADVGDVEVRVVATTPGSASVYRLDPLVASLARHTLWLTDAYFAGTSYYVQALRAAAEDGVDVRLLVPGPGSDIPLVQAISRYGYRALLDAGVRVFEWNGPMLHAKTAVADARWARVGSTNLNLSSWIGNRELDIVVENAAFGEAMEAMFRDDLGNATEIVLEPYRRVRPASGEPFRRPPKAGGSGTRAAAGALRLGNAIGSALRARRVYHPTHRFLAGQGALLLGALAIAGIVWPRLLAWPLAVLFLWFALALLARALRRRSLRPETHPDSREHGQ